VPRRAASSSTRNGNFTQYRSRLHSVTLYAGANAGTNSNIFYSFNQGLVHFLVYSAEAYAYKSGAELIANQKAFMKADLAAVDRSVTPWVVGLVHKDWTMEAEAFADFGPILEDGGVDLQFVGHGEIGERGTHILLCPGGARRRCLCRASTPRPSPHPTTTRHSPTFPHAFPFLPHSSHVPTLFLPFPSSVHYYNRYYPIDPVTGDIDKASVSADGSTYTNPKFLVSVVTGASGDKRGRRPVLRPPRRRTPTRAASQLRLGRLPGAQRHPRHVEFSHSSKPHGFGPG
jgi:hypothetical protein